MIKTKIVALLSIMALLASLPLTVALAQGAPYLVMGSAMLDDEPAVMGTMVVAMTDGDKVGEGEVFDDQGRYRLMINRGREGDAVTISLMMGEGDEAMEYMAMTDQEVVVGLSGERMFADLMAYTGDAPDPPAPTLTAAEEREAMRGPSGRQGLQGFQGSPGDPGVQGEVGPPGADGAPGPAGADGSDGTEGVRGPSGPAGAAGMAGEAGIPGSNGAPGYTGETGLAGADGATGPPGADGITGADGADGGGGLLIWVALIIAIVGAAAGIGAFITGRKSNSNSDS